MSTRWTRPSRNWRIWHGRLSAYWLLQPLADDQLDWPIRGVSVCWEWRGQHIWTLSAERCCNRCLVLRDVRLVQALGGDMTGSVIRRLREGKGVTQKALAAAVQLSPQYINDIERERRELTSEPTLARFAAGLDVPLDYLLFHAGTLPLRFRALNPTPRQVEDAYAGLYSALSATTPLEDDPPMALTRASCCCRQGDFLDSIFKLPED